MRISIICILISVFCFSVHARALENDNICKTVGDFSRGVMEARQNGVPLSQNIDALTQSFQKNIEIAPLYDYFREIAFSAYDAPLLDTAEAKQSIAIEFANMRELNCYRIMQKK